MPGGNGCKVANGVALCEPQFPTPPPTNVPWLARAAVASSCDDGGTTGGYGYCTGQYYSPLPSPSDPSYAPSAADRTGGGVERAIPVPSCVPVS